MLAVRKFWHAKLSKTWIGINYSSLPYNELELCAIPLISLFHSICWAASVSAGKVFVCWRRWWWRWWFEQSAWVEVIHTHTHAALTMIRLKTIKHTMAVIVNLLRFIWRNSTVSPPIRSQTIYLCLSNVCSLYMCCSSVPACMPANIRLLLFRGWKLGCICTSEWAPESAESRREEASERKKNEFCVPSDADYFTCIACITYAYRMCDFCSEICVSTVLCVWINSTASQQQRGQIDDCYGNSIGIR